EIDKWRERLDVLGKEDGTAVIWGAGSKGITFANATGMSSMAALVDINPRKQGLIAPGVGLAVAAPDDLSQIDPDLVLISNRQYETEIRATIHALGINPSFGLIAG
ncbi:MAG: methyltransferase, partial [bacterium]|nr:methyltransferase [bacterium]